MYAIKYTYDEYIKIISSSPTFHAEFYSRLPNIIKYLDESQVDEIVKFAVARDGIVLQHELLAKYRKDRKIVLLAVKSNGLALKYTPDFNADEEIIFAALANDGYAIEFINDELKNVRKYALAAVKTSKYAFRCVDIKWRHDADFMLEVLAANGAAIEFAYDEFKQDQKFVELAIDNDGSALIKVDKQFLTNKQLVIKALNNIKEYLDKYPDIYNAIHIYKHLSSTFQLDPEIIYAAILKNEYIITLLPKEFDLNVDFVEKLLQNEDKRKNIIKYLPDYLKNDNQLKKYLQNINNN